MRARMSAWLYWAPRLLGLLLAGFLSLFAFDVFGTGASLLEEIGAFLIHLVPVYLVLIALLIAWRWEHVGGLLFIALGVAYLLWARNMHWSAYLVITGPLWLVGALFLLGWRRAAHMPAHTA